MEYKETSLGKIPEDWDIFRIKELVKTYAGGTPLRSKKSYYGGNILWVKSGEVDQKKIFDTEEKITPDGFKNSSAKLVPKKSVLIAMYGATAGKIGIMEVEGTTNQAVLALPPNDSKYHHEFLYYMLSFNTQRFIGITQGTGQPNLSKQIIDNVKIMLPPRPEQQKIAEILTTIDKTIQKSDEIIAKTNRMKTGMMQKLLSNGIGHEEFKDTPIGSIPFEWKILELKNIGDFQYGYTTSAEEVDTGVKFLRITDIEEDGTINWNKIPFCSINKREFKKYELVPGDILFARIGATSGKTGFIDDNKLKSIFASYLIRLKVKENISPKFIFYYTQSNFYWSQVLKQREGQLKKGMNANMLSLLKIALPKDITEQQKIVEILSKIDELKINALKRRQKFQNIKKGLMNDLLKGNKRVQINN